MPFFKYTRRFLTRMKARGCGGGRGLLLGKNESTGMWRWQRVTVGQE